MVTACVLYGAVSVFRWQKYLICIVFRKLAFGVTDFSDADKRPLRRPPSCEPCKNAREIHRNVYINCWGSPAFRSDANKNCRSCYGSRSETDEFGGAQKAGQPQLLEHAFSVHTS